MKPGIYGLLLFVLICSCSSSQPPLTRVWFCNDDQTGEQKSENITMYNASYKYDLNGASFIDLKPDSSYTAFFSGYEYGKWYLRNNSLILVNQRKEILELNLRKINQKELICFNKMKNSLYRFNGFDNTFSSASEDPFSLENNKWRMKAEHKESDKEIALRLKNHFRYFEKYFAWGTHTDISSLDYTQTPGPLKMYGNGFSPQYLEYQLPEWRNTFFDMSDCRKAYEKLYYKMVEKDIQWPKTKDRYVRFVSAFKQMQQWMEQ